MIRLDKFLCSCGLGTRSEVKKDIRDGLVTVNGERSLRPEQQIDEERDQVCHRGKSCVYENGEKTPARPAAVRILDEKRIRLTITEGKFHQVKRMLHAVGNEVVYLKRLRMGTLMLDENLPAGSYRRLTAEETENLRK